MLVVNRKNNECEKVQIISLTFSLLVVRMKLRRKIGQKGQIVIPKLVRESASIKPGDDVIIEVRDEEIVIKAGTAPEEFVESFCSTTGKKLTKKIDLEKLIAQEAEEEFALH